MSNLPAIDLVDEAASSLRLAQESKPDELEALDREIVTLQVRFVFVYPRPPYCDADKSMRLLSLPFST